MTEQSTVGAAIERRDNTPAGLVEQYRESFEAVLPAHVRPDAWVRLVLGTLRQDAKLLEAAQSDTTSLLRALLHAARLGLEPGTDEYWLTPRKVQGRPTVLGIVGYQGLVKMIYNAGAVSSVVVEWVGANDGFEYVRGKHDRPIHTVDYDNEEGRGEVRLAYAYAVMKDGATSKVVVLDKHDIARIRKSSAGSDRADSPWRQHVAAMWMKSAARQLSKWVPTSPDRLGITAPAPVRVEASRVPGPSSAPAIDPPAGIDESEPFDDTVAVDGEVVDPAKSSDPDGPELDEHGWPKVAEPGSGSGR